MEQHNRLLVVTTNFPKYKRGDTTGSYVYDLADSLTSRFEVTVLAPHDNSATQGKEIMGSGIQVRRFNYFWPRSLQRLAYGYGIPENLKRSWLARIQAPFLFAAMTFAVLQNAKNADVIHCHWSLCALAALPAKFVFNKPLVLTVHGSDVRMFPDILTRFIVRNVDRITCAHKDLIATLNKLGASKKIREVRNLVGSNITDVRNSPSHSQDTQSDNETVLFVGRLAEMKDPLTFIDAVPIVLKQKPNVSFQIAGEGPQMSVVKQRIDQHEIQSSVAMLGHRSDVNFLLAQASIFLALSPRENMWSTTVVEAMKQDVPCIITVAGDTATIIQSGVEALLIPPRDPHALANAIIQLLDNPKERAQLVLGARELLNREGFSEDVIIEQMVEVFSECK